MLLEKQLSELTEDEIAEISYKTGLNHNDIVTGIEIINTSPRTGKTSANLQRFRRSREWCRKSSRNKGRMDKCWRSTKGQ